MRNLLWTLLLGLLLFSGCATKGYTPADVGAVMITYEGVVESARTVHVQDDGAGSILGGIIGAVLGHQIGGGSGRDVATTAGAITGAIVGSKLAQATAQELIVRLDNGEKIATLVRLDPKKPFWFRPGDRVRLYLRGNRVIKIEPIFLRD